MKIFTGVYKDWFSQNISQNVSASWSLEVRTKMILYYGASANNLAHPVRNVRVSGVNISAATHRTS